MKGVQLKTNRQLKTIKNKAKEQKGFLSKLLGTLGAIL